MYYELQDALGYRTDQNAPFNPTYSVAALPVSKLPISDRNPRRRVNALLVPGGVQPDLKMPTLISYSLRVEQALSQNTSLTVGYVGSHGYHEIVGVDANTPVPDHLPGLALPGDLSQHLSRRVGWYSGSGGFLLHPDRKAEGQHHAGEYLDVVFCWRQQLQLAAGGC